MKIRTLALLFLVIFSSTTWASDKQQDGDAEKREATIAFQRLVDSGVLSMTSDQPVWNVRRKTAWVKRRHTLSSVSYDVRNAQTIPNKIVGTASFAVRIDESAVLKTKEEALQVTQFNESRFHYEVSLNYSYIKGAWQYNNSRVKHFVDEKPTFDSVPTDEAILSNRFIVPLHYWMPDR